MGRRIYLSLTWCLLLGASIVSTGLRQVAAQIVNVTDPTRVISGEDVQSMGVIRLSDLFTEIAEARIITLDGFTTQFRLNGIGSFHESSPAVFVDGHLVELGFLATSDLNLIGLPAEIIDRVEVYARPSMISGVFAGQGAIHIFTKQANDDFELNASVHGGVDEADAGHLDFHSDERTQHGFSGPDVELSVFGELAAGSGSAAVVHRRHTHAARAPGRPLTTVLSPSAIYTLAPQRIHFSVAGLGAKANRFAYAPYASRLVGADHDAAALSVTASHQISDRGFLRHRATVDLSRTDFGQDSGSWQQSTFFWTSALARTLDERIVVLGGSAELRRVQLGAASADVRWGSVFAAIAGRMARGTNYRGGGTVAMDGRSVAVKAYGGITVARWENHRADVYVAVVDALLHEQNAADLWAREEIMPPLYPTDADRPHGDVALRATFDAEWRWQPDAFQELRVGVGIRRSEKIYLPSRMLQPAVAGGLRESIDFEYTHGTHGVLWGEFTTHVLPGRQRLFCNWQRRIVGRETYAAAWNTIPDLRLGISFTSPMFAGFRMRGSVMHESGTAWQEFDMDPTVDSDLSGSTRIDVFFMKRLFSGRLNASVGLQNALGDDILFHPLGDVFGRSIRVNASFALARSR